MLRFWSHSHDDAHDDFMTLPGHTSTKEDEIQPDRPLGPVMHIDELIQPSIGADLSHTPPMYRPGERIDGPSADTSAVRQ
jgi:hypothetical protein